MVIDQMVARFALISLMLLVGACGPKVTAVAAIVLTVSVEGQGTISSDSKMINCSAGNEGRCSVEYTSPMLDTLHADPAPGSRFVKWLGNPDHPCHETTEPTCIIDVDRWLVDHAAGSVIAMAAIFNDDYLQHANAWNELFEGDPGMTVDWTGGDHGTSMQLPYCDLCLPGRRYRRLWMFGDSLVSSIDDEGYRVAQQGSDDRQLYPGFNAKYGNVIGITYHNPDDSKPGESAEFHWGGYDMGVASPWSWMPLLIDPGSLPDMDPVRIALLGYQEHGFTNNGAQVYVHENPWVGDVRNFNLKPVFEFYNARIDANDYWTDQYQFTDPDRVYQGVAFYVYELAVEHTVPLYRYVSNRFGTTALATDPDLHKQFPGRDYQASLLLGYVHPATAIIPQDKTKCSANTIAGELSSVVCPLIEYEHDDPPGNNAHYTYTTWENDTGRRLLMWPNCSIAIGNDLVSLFTPVSDYSNYAFYFGGVHGLGSMVVSIVRGVDRPYEQWGKNTDGNWLESPAQTVIGATGDIAWGRMILDTPNSAQDHVVYIYGVKNIDHEEDNPASIRRGSSELYLARVIAESAEDLSDVNKWQYFSNGSWVSVAHLASPVADNIGPQSSVHFNPVSKTFIMVSTDPGLLPYIRFHRADSPTGPFYPIGYYDLGDYVNEAGQIQPGSYHSLYYAMHGHDGLSFDKDGLFMSYVRVAVGSTGWDPASDGLSSYYVPRFINLKWTEIDPE